MRKRMVLNEDFYKHYPYRIAVEQTVNKFLYLSIFLIIKLRKSVIPNRKYCKKTGIYESRWHIYADSF